MLLPRLAASGQRLACQRRSSCAALRRNTCFLPTARPSAAVPAPPASVPPGKIRLPRHHPWVASSLTALLSLRSMSASARSGSPVFNFPAVDLIPKKETNALSFRTTFPEYDGRNVVIGILDTGVDPGAAGLFFQEDGVTPKLIDMRDCSGSGDVDVSPQAQATLVGNMGDKSSYYKVQGLSGRTLLLSTDWSICKLPESNGKDDKNYNGGFKKVDENEASETDTAKASSGDDGSTETTVPVRLGLKRAYELYPRSVVSRMKTHRTKVLDKERDKFAADLRQQLADWKAEHGSSPTPEQVRVRDDLQARMDVLLDSEWNDDPGPMLDCVVFWDGNDYRAIVAGGADEGGFGEDLPERPDDLLGKDVLDLRYAKPMTDFCKERQYETLSAVDQFNYGVNIFDSGTVLSIVGDITPHGSHVAGIAAAAEGDRSGVAPGAQIISLKIGDSRMAGMETGTSVARALMDAVRLKCDLVNMSYGERCRMMNRGRVIDMAEEMVWRHNIMYLVSAGNNGPALSTAGVGSNVDCMTGIGAYTSMEMIQILDGVRSNADDEFNEEGTGASYTWTSVGPALDGFNGPSVSAPGGAISSVSNWTMEKSTDMRGTSMSCPNASGCVALLMSACKAESIPISPIRLQRAMENTALEMSPNVKYLQQGWGVIQVDRAYEYLKAHRDVASEDVFFAVKVEHKVGDPRGIYLRQQGESLVASSYHINIKPQFRRRACNDDESQKTIIAFEQQFALHSTVPWVSVPDYFMLTSGGRSFKINIDPTGLSPGVHTAKICGNDASNPDRGIVFSVPITVVKPLEVKRVHDFGVLELKPTEIKRFFVVPPAGSTWMDIVVRDCRDPVEDGGSSPRVLVLHMAQILPNRKLDESSERMNMHLFPGKTVVTSLPVEAGVTAEVALARYWSTSGVTKAEISVEFRGVRPEPSSLMINSGDGFAEVILHSEVQDEMIGPSAKLKKWRTQVLPKSEGVITPLGERDIQPWNNKRTYQLLLTYEFEQEESGSITPVAPMLQDVLYEANFEGQMMLIFDSEKKYLGNNDAFPGSTKVPKGTITIRLQVRHEDPSTLEKLNSMPIFIERSLGSDIELSAYQTRHDMLSGNSTMGKRIIRHGNCAPVVFAEPAASKIPSGCKKGDILTGTVTYCSNVSTLPGAGKRPGGFPLSYVVGSKLDKSTKNGKVAELKDERTLEERLDEAIRDLKIDQLENLTAEEKEKGKFEERFDVLIKEYPDNIPLLMARFKHIDGHKKRLEMFDELIESADAVVKVIPEDDLARHFGKKTDKDDPGQVKLNKEMESKKSNLIEALARKAQAIADKESADDTAETSTAFDDALKHLKVWVDIDSDAKYESLALEREVRAGRYGSALKMIGKSIAASKNNKDAIKPLSRDELFQKRSEIFQTIGYYALAQRDKGMRLVAAPKDYALF